MAVKKVIKKNTKKAVKKTKVKTAPKKPVKKKVILKKPAKKPAKVGKPVKKIVEPKAKKAAPVKSKIAKPVSEESLKPAKPAKLAQTAHAPSHHKQSSRNKPAAVKPKQVLSPAALAERRAERMQRSNQTFAYMKAPGHGHAFDVGDIVEVFCDHEKNRERIRGWVRGIVVQVDHKMVAVQFRSNVFLTDGWMVPDRILWYPITSDQIRSTETKKAVKSILPDY
jgi:hypothetical protein